MKARIVGGRWTLVVAMLACCGVFACTAVWGGLFLAESLLFPAHPNGQTTRSGVFPSLGGSAVLHGTFAATDIEALFLLFDDINKSDTPAQEDLVKSGRVFVVNDGTTVHLLSYYHGIAPLSVLGREYAGTLVRVRVLEGEYAGEAVWVPMEWVGTSQPQQ